MEYKINENECLRRDELPRLIHESTVHHASRDPIIKILESAFEEIKTKYSKNHKKTLGELNKEKDMLNFKKSLIEKTRAELLRRYKEVPEYISSVLKDICKDCNNNYQCQNYQNYQISKSMD